MTARADERARLRALAMRAGDGDESANDELCEYLFGSEHGLLALLDAADRAEAAEREAKKLRIDTYALFAERDRYRIRAETAERERDALRHDGQPVAWRVSFNQGETWTIYEREPAELHGRLDVLIAPLYDSGAVRVDAYRRAIRERGAERARAEAAERELASVLSDWNTVRDASGSKTNGGLAGHVAQLRARAERLEAALKFYAEREHLYGSLGEDWDTCSDVEYAGWLLPPDPVSDESWGVEDGSTARAALAALADPAPDAERAEGGA